MDKIDADDDGSVTRDELENWIRNVTHKNIQVDVEERWKDFEGNNTLDEYLDINYGTLKFCKNSCICFLTSHLFLWFI